MLLIKQGVDLSKLTGRMVLAAVVVRDVFEDLRANAIITSGSEGDPTDGVHRPDSKHYVGDALDFRILHLAAPFREQAAARCREALKGQFDVVLKPDHQHVEWDPK